VFGVGPTELMVILIIALLVFGPKRLPEVGRTLGKSLRELRRASDDVRGEITRALDVDDEGEPSHGEPVESGPSTTGSDPGDTA
jgi:sec-independent protein translocase protein TatA